MYGIGCSRRASSSRRSRYVFNSEYNGQHRNVEFFIFGTQASDVCGDPDEIDASITITEASKKSKKKLAMLAGGNETDELHRLRRYCDEVLERNKK